MNKVLLYKSISKNSVNEELHGLMFLGKTIMDAYHISVSLSNPDSCRVRF